MYVEIVETKKQLDDAFKVRTEVFVEEQRVPMEEEIDQYEDEAIHFVVYDKQQSAVGAGRLRFVDGYGKIERICIQKNQRGTGTGKLLMEKIENVAKQKGATQSKLNAQIQAQPFYQKLGYETVSEEFLDAGIPHVTMIKTF
ncbi:GNAT family N-acetyltransferase [Halalkalibacter akibai]|uniref:GNAT family acetyltransferase YjcF n=1 Tax=Halalkalibacter akibai (strain ATCC 43226 / DSM 21942 / CIP 109018 / JCM 9157 / 1139) TaxID=1236973 RepID=W4QNL0_HALA3|nr:GNAT family N-acetyltransferase [Halalkalibacter akibai]GAE33477.1 GNAT family acetyltransferase YjcF [Halalkalibacter akibai JCM 9157]